MTHENTGVNNKLMFQESFLSYYYFSEILSVLLSITATVLVALDHCKRRERTGGVTKIHTLYSVEKMSINHNLQQLEHAENPAFA